MFTSDPVNSLTDRIRLITGDTDNDELGYEDSVYQFAYDTNGQNENRAALVVLRSLVAKYANCATEKAGGLFFKGSEKFEQYKKVYNLLTKDPRNAILETGTPYTGGIYINEIENNNNNPNINHSRFQQDGLEKRFSRYDVGGIDDGY